MLQLKNINKRFGSKTVAPRHQPKRRSRRNPRRARPLWLRQIHPAQNHVGLVRPDSGEVWLNGDNITDMPSEKRNISLMFQDYALCRI